MFQRCPTTRRGPAVFARRGLSLSDSHAASLALWKEAKEWKRGPKRKEYSDLHSQMESSGV